MQMWCDGLISDDKALRGLSEYVKRIAFWSADKYRVQDYREDIYQDLMIALTGPIKQSWESPRDIGTYLSGWAWRIASNYALRMRREYLFDEAFASTEREEAERETDRDAQTWAGLVTHEDPEHHLMMSIPDSASRPPSMTDEALDRALRECRSRSRKKGASVARNALKPLKQNTKYVQDAGSRLAVERRRMALTRADMAEALGLPVGRYTAYETGKNSSIPVHLFEQIELLKSNLGYRIRVSEMLEPLSMSEIVGLWSDVLKIHPVQLCQKLDVTQRTMNRWINDSYRPKQSVVVDYHLQLLKLRSKIEKSHEK